MTILVLKYLAWALSTGLAFAGAWMFEFTKKDPSGSNRLVLTRPGKIALPIAAGGVLVAAVLAALQDHTSFADRAAAKANAKAQEKKLTGMEDSLKAMTDIFLAPATIQRLTGSDPALRTRMAGLAADENIRPLVAPATFTALAKFGIPAQAVEQVDAGRLSALQGELLAKAAGDGDVEGVRQFLEAGVDPNYGAANAELTPLHFAVLMAEKDGVFDRPNYVQVVKALLQRGGDPNSLFNGSTALASAAGGHVEIAKLLLAAGANPNVHTSKEKFGPLLSAVSAGSAAIVSLLLDAGADTSVLTPAGKGICELAKSKNASGVLPILEKRGLCTFESPG